MLMLATNSAFSNHLVWLYYYIATYPDTLVRTHELVVKRLHRTGVAGRRLCRGASARLRSHISIAAAVAAPLRALHKRRRIDRNVARAAHRARFVVVDIEVLESPEAARVEHVRAAQQHNRFRRCSRGRGPTARRVSFR